MESDLFLHSSSRESLRFQSASTAARTSVSHYSDTKTSSGKLVNGTLSRSVSQIVNQRETCGIDVASSPGVKQNKVEGHEPSRKEAKKKRERRTLEDLVCVCKELGDKSDKSGILARWKNYRQYPEWRVSLDLRLRDMIHEVVIKLEKLSRDLQTQGDASGKVRDVVRERYWEASPLTSLESTLKEEIFAPKWTRLQVKSWALYMESQIVFASICIWISNVVAQIADSEGEENSEMNSVEAGISLYNDLDLTSDIGSSDSSDEGTDINLVGYRLAADVKIPISRFTSRTRLELKRMSLVPRGTARAFQLALMFRLDVLGLASMTANWWRVGVDETDTLLLVLLSQEKKDRYPKHPLDCANAFLYLTSYIPIEDLGHRVFDKLGSLIDEILLLVVRDLRREYRRNLILAFGQRLPADIYENILDWVEAAHGIPRTGKEYARRLHHPREYAWLLVD
ncbi:hypothetical protein G6011_03441 [Alternaria panax]|uniref:Uncharacterized protein n=1 Tax=Alternaria panax TaxID=48097 RepID=A0AAD4IER1_9PLEO|nr:hypothetical protein G6011_03441 [Alternaria panax]